MKFKRTLLLCFLCVLLTGCKNKNESEEKGSLLKDEYGVCYDPEILKQDNVFACPIIYPEEGIDEQVNEVYLVSNSIESEIMNRYYPFSRKIFIGREEKDLTEYENYIPVLSYSYVWKDENNAEKETDSYSYKALPSLKEEEYSTEILSFPSRGRYYKIYNYSTRFYLDIDKVFMDYGLENISLYLTIRWMDKDQSEFVSAEGKSVPVTLFYSFSLKEDKTNVDVKGGYIHCKRNS